MVTNWAICDRYFLLRARLINLWPVFLARGTPSARFFFDQELFGNLNFWAPGAEVRAALIKKTGIVYLRIRQ